MEECSTSHTATCWSSVLMSLFHSVEDRLALILLITGGQKFTHAAAACHSIH